MCTALPPRRSPVIANTAATIHSLLWPTVRLARPPVDGARGVLRRPPVRLCLESGMTLPRDALRPLFLVEGVFVPRRTLTLRDLGRSTPPRSSPFLCCPITCPILRFVTIDLHGRALRLVHTKLLRREGPDPPRARQFCDPDLEPLPFFCGPVKLAVDLCGPGIEPRGDRVQIDTPQHQEHGHHDQHRKVASPAGGLAPQGVILRPVRDTLL